MTEKTLSVKDFKVVDVFPSGRDVLNQAMEGPQQKIGDRSNEQVTHPLSGLSGKLSRITSTDHYGQYPEFHKDAHLSDYIKDEPRYKRIQSPMAGKPWEPSGR